jgi:serine/threonine protein kinase/tetratricopeptide (TPR) repeat protein
MGKRIFFARFQEEEKLGQGGIGEVYRVLDLWEKKPKALKFLLPEFKSSPLEEAFRQEFFLLRKISHPNIVRVFDFHSQTRDSSLAYSMELVPGDSLTDFLVTSPQQLEWLMLQISYILEFIHLQGIIHCDLKPDNFRVVQSQEGDNWGKVKLLDFGLAESAELVKESKIKGTLDYMAPEILRGEPYSFSADLYSLGVILYELATKNLPFQDPDPAVLISKVLEQEPVPPRTLSPSISEEIQELILRLMAKNPQKRISSAAEVADYFAARVTSPPLQSEPGQALLQSGNWVPPGNLWEELRNKLRAPQHLKANLTILCGAPGAGKSSILQELYYCCQKENLPVLYWSIQGRLVDNCAPLCQRLLLLCDYQPTEELKPIRPLIERVLQAEDPAQKKKMLAQVIAQFPLTLLLDGVDLQNDSEFIQHLSSEHSNQNFTLFLTLNSFPGQMTQLEKFIHSHPQTERIELVQLLPLKPEELKELLEAKLPQFELPEKTFRRIWNFSGGSPGLALTYLKSLFEKGRLSYQKGKVILAKRKTQSKNSLESLGRYFDFISSGLDQAQRSFLQKLSILGPRFDLEAALHLSQSKVDECYEHLRYLLREGIILPQIQSEKIEYEFSPPGLQKLLYEEIATEQKKEFHRQAAEYLEGLRNKGELVPAKELAHHFLQGQLIDQAYAYSMLAAEEGLKSLAKPEILKHFRNAYHLASELSDNRERILRQGQVLRKRAHFWKTIGNFQKALSDYRKILKLFDKNSRQKILAEAYKDLGDLCRLKNNYRKGMVYLQRAEEIYRALDDKPELAHTLNNIGNLYWIALQYEQALKYLNSALELHRSLGNLAGAGSTLNNLAGVYLAMSQYEKSIQYYRESLEIHRQLEIPEETSRVLNNLGVVYMYLANYHPALESLLESLELNQQTANLREQVFNLENLGECYQKLGNQTQALQYSQQGLKLADQIGFTLRKGRIHANAGKSHFELADYSSALEHNQKALEIATQLGDWETQAWVLVYLAEFYWGLNQPPRARENLTQAEPILKKLDDSRAGSYYHLIAGRVYQSEQNYQAARNQFQKSQQVALEKNLLEERLTATLALAWLDLETENKEESEKSLRGVQSIFVKGEFSRFKSEFTLLQAHLDYRAGQTEPALQLAETGLVRACQKQEWPEAIELAYLCGQCWQEQKNYEKAYLAWEKGVTILKQVYQKILQSELKQSYLQGQTQQKLLAGFKKIAAVLAGSTP